jgi:PTH1 family peptidyl-tRNA hydrolase
VSGYVIVGLGNPGRRYAGTRHNVGFLVADLLAERGGMRLAKSARLHADIAEGRLGPLPGTRVVVAKPLTFMNDSGAAVAGVLRFYAGDFAASGTLDRLIVVHDEIDLPFGSLRVKSGGGDNGHNGVKSVRASLRSGDFTRVRVGVGRPARPASGAPPEGQRPETADWVLSTFSAAERAQLPELVERAADAVEYLTEHDLADTQSRFNS